MSNVTVTFGDGTSHTYQDVPEGVTPDQIEQRALKDFSGKKVTSLGKDIQPVTPAAPPQTTAQKFGGFLKSAGVPLVGLLGEGTTREKVLAEPATRAIIGAAGPVAGAAQVLSNIRETKLPTVAGISPATGVLMGLSNIGGYLAGKLGLKPETAEEINKHLADLEAEKQKAMEAQGRGTTDVAGLVGGVASGALLTRGMAPAATIAGRAAQGAATGAAMGATAPVTSGATGERYFDEKGNEILLGGVMGAALEPLLRTVAFVSKYPYHLLERFVPGGKEVAAGRAMGKAAGPQKGAVISELEKPRELVPGAAPTAGEAATAAQSPGFSALQKAVTGVDVKSAGEYGVRARAQEEARSAALAAKPAEEIAKERKAVTDPLRNIATEAANLAGTKGPELAKRAEQKASSAVGAVQDRWRLLSDAAKQENLSKNFYPVPGMPRIAGRYSDNAERVPEYLAGAKVFEQVAAQRRAEQKLLENQLASIEAHDLKPLTSSSILSKIDTQLSDPAFKESNKAPLLKAVRDKIARATNENGVIDSRTLYTIRKELNETIEGLLGGADVSGNKARAAQLASELRPVIDKSLDRASGGEWSKYMNTYKDLSKKMDQSKIMAYLNNILDPALEGGKQRASAFAKAMSNALKTIEASTEFAGAYKNLEDVLTPEQLKSVNGVLADLNRQSEFERLAKEGQKAIGKQIGQVGKDIEPIGGTLNQAITLASAVIRRIQGGVGEKTLADISEIMQDPKRAAQVMRAADESERKALLMIARATSPKAVGAAMGGVEGTAAERQRRKAERAAKEAVQ